MVRVFTTSFRMSETTIFVFIASSVWKRTVGNGHTEVARGTHVEDMKNPVEVQPPGGDLFLVVPRVEEPRGRISFAPLGDVPLDFGRGPVIESLVNESPGV